MIKPKYSIPVLIGLSFNFCFSQESFHQFTQNKKMLQGHQAFHQEEYRLAYQSFLEAEVSDDLSAWKEVYLLLCDLYLKNDLADEKVKSYLDRYPSSVHKSKLSLALGDYYFSFKNSKAAQQAYKQVDVKSLTNSEEATYNFKLGFLFFQENKYLEAKKYLLPLKNDSKYGEQVNYYLGNIALQDKDFEVALKYFNAIKEVPKYKKEIAYHTLVILYKSKKYKEAISFGETVYQGFSKVDQQEIAKILGECYFYVENYKAAAIYLEQYPIQKKTNVDYYFLGFSYFKSDDFEKAVQNFNKIVNGKDPLSQNAYYHLAACYLKQNLKSAALNAFKNAAEMEDNPIIKEDALYNYAKLSYEIGNAIEPSALVMQRYVQKYPTTENAKNIEKLIINAYLEFKDYLGVINYYEQNNLKKDQTYQTALLEKGFELYQENSLKGANEFFSKASNLTTNNIISARALFWKAETNLLMQNYSESIVDFRAFKNLESAAKTTELNEVNYSLGFALYQDKKYSESLLALQQFTMNSMDAEKVNNAFLRMADCYYAIKEFNNALELYSKLILLKHIQTDYALFQKAMCLGYLGNDNLKKETLLVLQTQYQKSVFIDKSYFELGALFIKNNDFKSATDTFETLISKYPNSPMVSKAMLKIGSIHYNNGENLKALEIFKAIVAKYPGTSDGVQAVRSAKLVYQEIDDTPAYSQWVKTLDFINITDAQLDKTMFEAAEKKYVSGEYEAAVNSLKKYLATYANGLHVLLANYYLADAYYMINNLDAAIEPYNKVILVKTSEYQEDALNKLAQIYIQKQEWDLAKPLLLSLEADNFSTASFIFAQSNLMKYYDVRKQYDASLTYSEKVLTNKESSDLLKLEAYLYGARAAFQLGNYDLSKRYFLILEKQGKMGVKAEAQYYKAKFLWIAKNYQQSNIEAQKLPSQFQQYRYWGIKALLLMAQNYYELKDVYQANYILNSIVENANDLPELVMEAKQLLEKYQPINTNTPSIEELTLETVKS